MHGDDGEDWDVLNTPSDLGWWAGYRGLGAECNPYKEKVSRKTWERWRRRGKDGAEIREQIRREKEGRNEPCWRIA